MFPVALGRSCIIDKNGKTDLNAYGLVYCASHYFVTLVAIAVINALVLSGHLSGVVGAYINLGIGGGCAIISIAQIGLDARKGQFFSYHAIQVIASLAIAASGLTFLNLLSMKTAAIIALGSIALPTVVAGCMLGCQGKKSSSSSQAAAPNENGLSTSTSSTGAISQNKVSVASSATSPPTPSVNWSNFKTVKSNWPMNPMTYVELYSDNRAQWAYGLRNESNQVMMSEIVATRAELTPYKAWLKAQGYSPLYPSA